MYQLPFCVNVMFFTLRGAGPCHDACGSRVRVGPRSVPNASKKILVRYHWYDYGHTKGGKQINSLCYKFQGLTSSLLCTDTNTTLQIHSSSNRSRIAQTRTVNANNADDKYVLTHIRTIDAARLIRSRTRELTVQSQRP